MRLAKVVRSNVDRQRSSTGRSGRDREAGAVAMIVAMLFGFGVLLGLGALVIDTGSLLYERRQLQNGADAAALSAATVCAKADQAGTPCKKTEIAPLTLVGLAGLNAADGMSDVTSVCVSAAVLAANPTAFIPADLCAVPPPAGLVECPNQSSTAGKYIEVRTATNTGSASILPPILAQTLVGGTYTGETVKACTRAGWGPPSSVISAIPITISQCEFNEYTVDGLEPAGPYAPTPLAYPSPDGFPYEHRILFHDETGIRLTCPQGPSGADVPGGFGYLQTTGCNATVSATGIATVRTGNPSNAALGCDFTPLLSATTGQPVFVPIYTDISGGNYTLDSVAAFWLTGFSTSGNRHASDASGRDLCSNDQTCLYGWFTLDIDTSGSFGGGGTPRGAIEVGVTG